MENCRTQQPYPVCKVPTTALGDKHVDKRKNKIFLFFSPNNVGIGWFSVSFFHTD